MSTDQRRDDAADGGVNDPALIAFSAAATRAALQRYSAVQALPCAPAPEAPPSLLHRLRAAMRSTQAMLRLRELDASVPALEQRIAQDLATLIDQRAERNDLRRATVAAAAARQADSTRQAAAALAGYRGQA